MSIGNGPGVIFFEQTVALLTLDDFERNARQSLSAMAYEYLHSGVADEVTVADNRAAFERIKLMPAALVDVSEIDTSVTLFGRRHPFPILLAPTGYHKLFHEQGEIQTVKGADLSEAQLVAASFATVSFEEMSAVAARPLAFQLYFQIDRECTRDLVQRVVAAGCEWLCVTVDVPVNGPRDRELNANFALPEGTRRANLSFMSPEMAAAPHRASGRNFYSALRSPSVTWKDMEWLRSTTPLPIAIKGILNPADAARAVEYGCNAVIVSNHGGRSVDTLPAAIDALPRIVQRIGGRVPVLMDGGVRRGTDAFKALALGASAVMIGRPYLYGLAVDGAAGVARVVEILRTELEMTMGFTGFQNVCQITADRLWI
jgi:4-hydroxymandelate oxidase